MTLHDGALERLGKALAEAQDDAVAMRRRVWQARLREEVLDMNAWAPRRVHPAWWVATCAMAAGLLLWAWSRPPASLDELPSLERPPVGAPAVVQHVPEVLEAPQDEPLQVAVAESRVVLQPGGKLRLVSTEDGHRVEIEEGRAQFFVAPQSDEMWVIVSRDMTFRTTDAAFWVEVGAHVHIEVQSGEVEVLEERGTTRRLGPPEEELEPEPVRGQPPVSARKPPKRPRGPSPSAPDWQALATQGDFNAAWEVARRQDVAKLRSTLPARALLRLADVARYSGHRDDAREILLTVRQRFPGDAVAAMAAFDLARLEGRRCERAEKWLKTYLEEQPRGTMAKQAHARLLECKPAPH